MKILSLTKQNKNSAPCKSYSFFLVTFWLVSKFSGHLIVILIALPKLQYSDYNYVFQVAEPGNIHLVLLKLSRTSQ